MNNLVRVTLDDEPRIPGVPTASEFERGEYSTGTVKHSHVSVGFCQLRAGNGRPIRKATQVLITFAGETHEVSFLEIVPMKYARLFGEGYYSALGDRWLGRRSDVSYNHDNAYCDGYTMAWDAK